MKTEFEKYSKGKYTEEIVRDLFGEGIFAVDGEKWRHQRKLASYEFSTRVLRDFSCSAFRTNAAKLVRLVKGLSRKGLVFDMQVSVRTSKIFLESMGLSLKFLFCFCFCFKLFTLSFKDVQITIFFFYILKIYRNFIEVRK